MHLTFPGQLTLAALEVSICIENSVKKARDFLCRVEAANVPKAKRPQGAPLLPCVSRRKIWICYAVFAAVLLNLRKNIFVTIND